MKNLQSPHDIRVQIRRQALQQRRQLSIFQQQTAGRALCRRVRQLAVYRKATTVALYLSVASEIPTADLLQMALRDGKRCYVPVLHPWQPGKMLFVPFTGQELMKTNRWGIAEPPFHAQRSLRAQQFDLVMMPLVAFDDEGHRLGMGKGFYDRAFAFRQQRTGRPFLLGLAHECQRSETLLPVNDWDVDVDAVATAARIRNFRADRSVPLRSQGR